MLKYYHFIELTEWKAIHDNFKQWLFQKTNLVTSKKTGFFSVNLTEFKTQNLSIFDLFLKSGFEIISIAFYVKPNYIDNIPHIDYSDVDARINIPILNCENVYTEFYKDLSKEDPILIENAYGAPYYFLKGPFKKIDYCVIDRPTIISIKTPHTVKVPLGNPLPRISATIKVHPDPASYLR